MMIASGFSDTAVLTALLTVGAHARQADAFHGPAEGAGGDRDLVAPVRARPDRARQRDDVLAGGRLGGQPHVSSDAGGWLEVRLDRRLRLGGRLLRGGGSPGGGRADVLDALDVLLLQALAKTRVPAARTASSVGPRRRAGADRTGMVLQSGCGRGSPGIGGLRRAALGPAPCAARSASKRAV